MNLERMDEAGREASAEVAAEQSKRPRLIQAKRLHARGVELRRQLAQSAKNPHRTLNLAEALRNAGMLEMRAGDSARSKELLEESIGILRPLVAEHPKETKYRAALAKTTEMLGDWYFDLKGDLNRAESCYRLSVAETGRLAADSPDDPEAQLDHANAWSRLADVHGQKAAALKKAADLVGSDAEKEKELTASRKEVEITDKLLAAAPDNAQYLADALISYDHLARGLLSVGRYDEALPNLRKSFDHTLRLIEADPENRRHHVMLVRRTARLAAAYQRLQQPAEALIVYEAGLERFARFKERTGEAVFERETEQMRQAAEKLRLSP